MKESNPWKKIATQLIYENPWLRLREDKVIRPDGTPGIYGVVEIGRSAGIVACNENDQIVQFQQLHKYQVFHPGE